MKYVFTFCWSVMLFFVSLTSKAQLQFASGVRAFSSQWTSTDWSAQQATGIPNVKSCASIKEAWASLTADGQREFLELEYSNPTPINRIFIYEIFNPGAVDTVYVLNPNTQLYEKVFTRTAVAVSGCPRVMTVIFPTTLFPVSRIRIAINSPAVIGWNEIDAVGIDRAPEGGKIKDDQIICASTVPNAISSEEPGFSGAPGVVYQWQQTTDRVSWQDIAGAVSEGYQPPLLSQTTWFRRQATLDNTVALSNEVKLDLVQAGDPAVFPLDAWNFYVYNNKSIDLNGTSYRGYYSRTALNIKTSDDFNVFGTPEPAAGYRGCTVAHTNFTFVSKRKGFPAGNYTILLKSTSMPIRIFVNGNFITDGNCCNTTVSLGFLGPDSEVEFRQISDSRFYQEIEFSVSDLNGGAIDASQSLCNYDMPALFTNKTSAYGGAAPTSITYQWQDSVANGSWQNIPSATAATYQSPILNAAKWFRRKASDNTNAAAYSNEIKIDVAAIAGDTAQYAFHAWNFYAFHGNEASLANAKYRGYYSATGLKINTANHWYLFFSPSVAPGYLGCPVNADNFTLSGRRKGFDAGTYEFIATTIDDIIQIRVNDVEVYTGGCCNVVNLGKLNAQSKVELRLVEGTGGSMLAAELKKTDSSIYEFAANNCFSFDLPQATGNQWLDITDGNNNIVASINPNGNNLGTVTVSIRHFGNGSSNIPTNPVNKKRYMPRYFNFTSSAYPGGNFPNPVQIRLYFKNSEFADYKLATSQPALSLNQLKLGHYNGANEDCDMSNNTNQGDAITAVAQGFTPTGFYLEGTTATFSEFGVLGGNQTLPVTLTQFKAVKNKNEVQLSWTTSQEINNKGFEVLRSADGNRFEKIGWVDGAINTNTTKQYTYSDKSPVHGKNFYRLRQVDLNEHSELSNIVIVDMKTSAGIQVGPNPVNDVLYITANNTGIRSIRITDMQGQVKYKSDRSVNDQVVSIAVSHLSAALYLIEIEDAQGNRQTAKFLKK
ncbi:T9SS type A sorting domain-containing protein [Pseudoflavitalea sp. G-6-1-2]|uniref:T9SS type A sorting domain-containing protein n=1 Tax=Pseudoflavitalea sp. G-6-1-2 TaxID=2728841 RepID=UPI00146E042D|nr:T9SS type A sorting domain-containing protein [Pseudoflavitalea sp. G-6-1-2]NML23020.1 T9SS type A sorting domain-containing protein [Pseudoflavitalea sp. G-6-1-2]